MRLTQGSPPDMASRAVRGVIKPDPIRRTRSGIGGQRVADPRVVLMTQDR